MKAEATQKSHDKALHGDVCMCCGHVRIAHENSIS